MQVVLEMNNLSNKQCASLRRTLLDAYKIIAQGANDIMHVRHDVSEKQNEHRKKKQLLLRKLNGKQLITDWLGQGRKRAEADTDNSTRPSSTDDDECGRARTRMGISTDPADKGRTIYGRSYNRHLPRTQNHGNARAHKYKSQTVTEYSRWRYTSQ